MATDMCFGQPTFGFNALKNLVVTDLLGQGETAKVYEVKCVTTGKTFALKVLHKRGRDINRFKPTLVTERDILVKVSENHVPFVTRLYSAFQSNDYVFFLMDLCNGGTIKDSVEYHGALNEKAAKFYSNQILSAIKGLHQQGIYHRDINADNVLLDSNGNIMVSDFGGSYLTGAPQPKKCYRDRSSRLKRESVKESHLLLEFGDTTAFAKLLDLMVTGTDFSKDRLELSDECRSLLEHLDYCVDQIYYINAEQIQDKKWFDDLPPNSSALSEPAIGSANIPSSSAAGDNTDIGVASQSEARTKYKFVKKFCRSKKNSIFVGRNKFKGTLANVYFNYTIPARGRFFKDFDYIAPGIGNPFE